MKRRKLLRNAVIATTATAGASVASGERLFGVPNSITTGGPSTLGDKKRRLRLSMSRNDVPPQMWKRFEALQDFWEEVSSNPDNYKMARDIAISSDEHLGDFMKDERFNTEEHKVLLKLSDPRLIQYANDGDYITLLNEMNDRGLLELGDSLADDYAKALAANESAMKRLKSEFSERFSSGIYEDEDMLDDISYFKSKIIPTSQLNVRNNAVAAINVAAAVNVVAAINVAVAVALAVTVAVATSVTVCGASCHGKLPASEKLQKDIESVSLLAKKVGNQQLAEKTIIELHCREAASCLSAVEKLGLVRIDDTDRKEVYRNLYKVVRKSLEA